jgi:hypothetical protein
MLLASPTCSKTCLVAILKVILSTSVGLLLFLEVGLNISKLWFNISNWILDNNFNCWVQLCFFSKLVFTKNWMQVPSPHLGLQSWYSFLPSSHKMNTSICNQQLENSPCDSFFNVGFIGLTLVSNSTSGILRKKPLTLIILMWVQTFVNNKWWHKIEISTHKCLSVIFMESRLSRQLATFGECKL